MVLLVAFYQDRNPARMDEIIECLRRNLANEHIVEIHVLLEDRADPRTYPVLADPKLRLIQHGRRVTFRELFEYAGRAVPGRRVIVANSDVYFDHSLVRLDGYDFVGKLLCLSRWDVQTDGSSRFFAQSWSQDAWVFEAPIPVFACDWHLGLPGCENRLAWEADRAGLRLANPSRSVRTHHLHLSDVRHYTERQRLDGNGCGVEASFLGSPWLWPIVPCMARLADVKDTFGALVAQPHASCILVDYACPDGAAAWLRVHHPHATAVSVTNRHRFNLSEARNRGAAAADEDGVLCFLDADVTVTPEFSNAILSRFDEHSFLVPDGRGHGLDSALVCSKAAFDRVGGYDETYHGWGEESVDIRAVLRRAGLVERTFHAGLLTHRGHSSEVRARFCTVSDLELSGRIDATYRRLKTAIAGEIGDGVASAALRDIHRALTHRLLVEHRLVPEAPDAAVAFRETMGYTIAFLEPGASSHNNDLRPFEAIPPQLAGKPFTQVVSSRVSPVWVEFVEPGKLYVLVGTDWDGYHVSAAFLRAHGYREPLPPVRTQRGTAFEVWSLVGEAGVRLELPTQVMLVARQLIGLA